MPPPPRARIYQNGSGTWELHVSWPGTGKRLRKTLRTKIESEAKQSLSKLKPQDYAQYEKEAFGEAPTKHPRLDEMASWYFEIKLPQADAARHTLANYGIPINSFIRFAGTRKAFTINQVSSRLIQDWQADRNGGKARRDDLLTLRRWIAEYLRFHPEAHKPPLEWDIPKRKRGSRFKAISEDQLGELLSTLGSKNPELYRITAWIAYTGWLIGDASDLRYGQIRGQIIERVRLKTGRPMVLPLTEQLAELIDTERAHLTGSPSGDAHVFISQAGRAWQNRTYQNALQRHCERHLSWQCNSRDLRVTYGTMQAEAGCPQHILADLMGHETTEALKYYTRVSLEMVAMHSARHTENVRNLTGSP